MTHTFIIAECGVNHGGDFEKAKEMIPVAMGCGADAVKFQLWEDSHELAMKRGNKLLPYQQKYGYKDQEDMLGQLRLSLGDMNKLKDYAIDCGIEFMCTPFDLVSLRWVASVCKRIKWSSGMIGELDLLEEAARYRLPMIISTGGANDNQIGMVCSIVDDESDRARGLSPIEIILLHCTPYYPTPLVSADLTRIKTLHGDWGGKVGYSDHTRSIYIPCAAVALGACAIEKHFTLDRTWGGPDQETSLLPHELEQMVRGIREVEAAL